MDNYQIYNSSEAFFLNSGLCIRNLYQMACCLLKIQLPQIVLIIFPFKTVTFLFLSKLPSFPPDWDARAMFKSFCTWIGHWVMCFFFHTAFYTYLFFHSGWFLPSADPSSHSSGVAMPSQKLKKTFCSWKHFITNF